MSSIFTDGALHPGRDANDASWMILRAARDWETATFRDAAYDPGRKVIELAARPLDGVGALACVTDERGLRYITEPDHHRVRIIEASTGSLVLVLGCTNAWGEPVAGIDHGAMTEPVAVAVAPQAIYIADRAGHRVHVFDRSFRWVRTFAPAPEPVPPGFVSTPVALGVSAAGELLVADAALSSLLRFGCDGAQLANVPFTDPSVPSSLAWLATAARFAPRGEVIVGPIDGGIEDLAWHRVIVDAHLPRGAKLEVQTFASAEIPPVPPPPPPWPAPIPWAPAVPVAMPDRDVEHDGEVQRPVLSDTGRWQRARHGDYVRGSPVIAEYRGDGPLGVAQLVLRGAGLARVRTGDVVELAATQPAPATERVTVGVVPARTVRFAAHGELATPFGAGTLVTLRLRDGHEPFAGPRMLYELAGTDVIDLSTVLADGSLFERSIPHAAAALMRRGDVIDLVGPTLATIVVDDIASDPLAVPLLVAPGADFRHSVVRIVETSERLLLHDVEGLDEHVPPDEPITVRGIAGGVAFEKPAAIHWVEPELGVVWLAPSSGISWPDWERFATIAPAGTDRGRYLWLRLHLIGATAHSDDDRATATPTIRSVRLLRPRLSYLRYLPGTFARRDADDPTGALFLERMLAMFEHELTRIEGRYESVARQLDPYAADPEWLRFLAAWFDLYLDPALPLERKRRLVAEAHALFAIRGTSEGIRRYIEIITGQSPAIVEGQQVRPSSGIILGCTGVVGCSSLGGADETSASSTAFLDRYAHRATIYVFVDDPCRREQVEASLRHVIASIVPAHVVIDLRVVAPDARVGWQSTVGIDLVLGDGRMPRHVLGEAGVAAERPHPVLGLDPILASNPSLRTDDVGVRIDHGLLLE